MGLAQYINIFSYEEKSIGHLSGKIVCFNFYTILLWFSHLYCDDGAYDAAFCSRFGHTEYEILLDDNLGVSSKMVAFVRPKEMKKKAEEL